MTTAQKKSKTEEKAVHMRGKEKKKNCIRFENFAALHVVFIIL